ELLVPFGGAFAATLPLTYWVVAIFFQGKSGVVRPVKKEYNRRISLTSHWLLVDFAGRREDPAVTDIARKQSVSWRDFYEMCKPRVVMLMILTSMVGMFLAVPGMVPLD